MNITYDTRQATNNIELKDVAYLTPGIHENIYLTAIRFDRSPNTKSAFIEYTFNKGGATVKSTEWEIIPRSTDKEADIAKRAKTQANRMRQILLVYLPMEKCEIVADGFEAFAKEYISRLESVDYKNIPVRLKVVLNDSDYTTLPKTSKYTFIEPMTIPAEESVIRILTIDRVTKNTPDIEKRSDNPFESTDDVSVYTSQEETEDSPF